MKNRALITYSWNRVGYNILRSLKNLGLEVYTADTSSYNICTKSKFCDGFFVYPDPFKFEEEFIQCLISIVLRLKPKVLIPTHDESIIIAKHINRFPKDVIIPIESYEKLTYLSNKYSASLFVKNLGVPVPNIITHAESIKNFPVVCKAKISNSAKDVYFPTNNVELSNILSKYNPNDIFIQEKATGTDFCVDCIRYGKIFYASVYKAIITKTKGGGTTTQRITVENNTLVKYAKIILDAADYNGVCGIDFKYNEQTKESAFIEINARYTGGLATTIASGFDMPTIQYQLVTQTDSNIKVSIKIGTKTKWILGDIITLVSRLLSLNLTLSEIKNLLNFKGFDAYDDFRSDDKKAILGEFAYYLNKLIKNRKLNP